MLRCKDHILFFWFSNKIFELVLIVEEVFIFITVKDQLVSSINHQKWV